MTRLRAGLLATTMTLVVLLACGVALAAMITGTARDETLIGTSYADTIRAKGGVDEVRGLRGADDCVGVTARIGSTGAMATTPSTAGTSSPRAGHTATWSTRDRPRLRLRRLQGPGRRQLRRGRNGHSVGVGVWWAFLADRPWKIHSEFIDAWSNWQYGRNSKREVSPERNL
jgi:hypothetical protein